MNFYDFHTHLNDPKLFPNRKEYLVNFVKIWWKWLVNVWVDYDWNIRAIDIARKSEEVLKEFWRKIKVFATIGYHPSEICFWNIKEEDFNFKISKLRDLYLENKDVIVWIWECGIDVHYPKGKETLKLQKEFFALQCDLADELELPIIVHSRDDFNSTFDILKNYKNLKIYFHCWGYWPEEIRKILSYFPNVWVGFAWNVSYPKANRLRESLKLLPFEKMVLETDAPYLTPQVVRGKVNEPANVKYIFEFVSRVRDVEIDKLCNIMEENFNVLYSK